jgi:hypothetical protein
MEEYPSRTPVNTRLGFDGPGGCAVLMKDPSLTETHRPSRIAAAIADPSSVIRTCVTAQLVAGAKREAVLKSLLSDYLDRCCATWTVSRKPQEVVRTFDRSPFGGSRNTRSQRTERTVEFHQGISAGATWGNGIVDRIKPHFLVPLSWGIKDHRHCASVGKPLPEWANESISRLKTESFRQDFRHSIQSWTLGSPCAAIGSMRPYDLGSAASCDIEIVRLEGKAGTNSVDGDGRRECPSRGTMVSTADR